MSLEVPLPGAEPLALEYLVLDANGTLTDHGVLIDGVEERVRRLSRTLWIHMATADTFGAAESVAARLGVDFRRVATGADKERLVRELGPAATAAIGNGANDVAMLRTARLGIAVLGPEGASGAALAAADVVATTIGRALDLLGDPSALQATLRP